MKQNIKNIYTFNVVISNLWRVHGTSLLRSLQINVFGIIFYAALGVFAIFSVLKSLTPVMGFYSALVSSMLFTLCAIHCEIQDLYVSNDSVVKKDNQSSEHTKLMSYFIKFIDFLGTSKWALVLLSSIQIFYRFNGYFQRVFIPFMGVILGSNIAVLSALSAGLSEFILNYINIEKVTLQSIAKAPFITKKASEWADGHGVEAIAVKTALKYKTLNESDHLVFNVVADNDKMTRCVSITKDNCKEGSTQSTVPNALISLLSIFGGTALYVFGDYTAVSAIAYDIAFMMPSTSIVMACFTMLSVVVAVLYQITLWGFNLLYNHIDEVNGKLKPINDLLGWSPESRMTLLVLRQTLLCITDLSQAFLNGNLGFMSLCVVATLPCRIIQGEAQAVTTLESKHHEYNKDSIIQPV